MRDSVLLRSAGQRLDFFCKVMYLYISFTESNWPPEAILDSSEKVHQLQASVEIILQETTKDLREN